MILDRKRFQEVARQIELANQERCRHVEWIRIGSINGVWIEVCAKCNKSRKEGENGRN